MTTMRKTYILILTLISFSLVNAQVIQNRSYTDCSGVTRTIYGVLSQGRPLVIASNGLDCPICMSHAPAWETFANQNSQIEVWGAMTFTYSSSTPNCTQVSTWNSNYGWNTIWTFIDSSRTWLKVGTPRYYVIDPSDSTIAYEGGNTNQARSVAISLAGPLKVSENGQIEWNVWIQNGMIHLKANVPNQDMRYRLLSITGQEILSGRSKFADGTGFLPYPEETPPGLYLILLEFNDQRTALKLIIQ